MGSISKQFVKYSTFGGIGVAADLCCFVILIRLLEAVGYIWLNVASYLLGTVVSFLLNDRYNFEAGTGRVKRLLLFCIVAFIGMAISSFLLEALIVDLTFEASIAKTMTLPLVLLIQYSLNRYITFKPGALKMIERRN